MNSHNSNDNTMEAHLNRMLKNWADYQIPPSQSRVNLLQKVASRESALKNSFLPLYSWNSRKRLYHPGVFQNVISSGLFGFHSTGSLFHPVLLSLNPTIRYL